MKKTSRDETTGAQIDALELAAFRGHLSRRRFITGLTQLGISLSVAGAMAARAETAWLNRSPLRDEYDYIVVGAGSAGCVLANRISAAGATVLLIEAGTDQIDQPKIAEAEHWLENLGSATDWNRPILPQRPLNNRQLYAPAGKVVGGTGSINGMFWLRGDLRDAQQWCQSVGPNWDPFKLYRAFLRVEDYQTESNPLRGHTGPIKVNRYASENPITAASIEGARELGLPAVDHNASALIDGAGIADVNILPNGRRSGPAQAYLLPALENGRVTLLANALVTELTLKGSHCRGVKVVMDGRAHYFAASREVVLCAGAFGSPRLLLLSGIGPERELHAAGVRVRTHLPGVGKNLHDHILLQGLLFEGGPEFWPSATLGRIATHAFFRTNSIHAAPNIQVMCMQTPFPPDALPEDTGFSILPWIAKPESRGSLALTSAEPRAPLAIDPGYFREESDWQTMLAALDYSISLGLSEAMSPFVSGLAPPASPYMNREEKLAFTAENAIPGLHWVGTCAAGHDPGDSVVDEFFRVWGIDGLRVVDASVIPEVPGVNPHPSILSLAELAAETMGFTPV